MSDTHIPSDNLVRSAYVYAQLAVNGHVDPDANFGNEFDLWMKQHDAKLLRDAGLRLLEQADDYADS